jgi:Resolvase, N terminal domain
MPLTISRIGQAGGLPVAQASASAARSRATQRRSDRSGSASGSIDLANGAPVVAAATGARRFHVRGRAALRPPIAKGREQRSGLDKLLQAVARREVDMVLAWSLDRLGRPLQDLLTFLTDLHAKGVDLFLHQQGLDTSTPSGRAMFQMLGVFAEFERAMIRERVMTGLARARAEGKQLGRRTVEQSHAAKVKAALKMRSRGVGIRRIAREAGLGVGTVIRLVGNAQAA